jgi:hypothetical protein
VGTQPVDAYCREIETYLCRKNDGHLIRVVGPSFELVSRWAALGVPLKIAQRGIDRCFERYYRKGPRRRPVKIDFCEADVLDAFDEWRRAVGLAGDSSPETAAGAGSGPAVPGPQPARDHRESLPAHLGRILLSLSNGRARGSVTGAFDDLIDRVAGELDVARADARGVRGEARHALIARLDALDAEMLDHARAALDEMTRGALETEADAELAGFRAAMAPDAFARARAAVVTRLVRERFGLPTIAFR